MASNDSTSKTLIVALLLSIVCSIVVSAAAVMLKPAQQANKERDFKKNILAAAHMLDEGKKVNDVFESNFTTRVVDLETGKFTDAVDPETYDQRAALNDPKFRQHLGGDENIAGLSGLEKYAEVYINKKPNGEIDKIVLPIRGYGLWSTLYGFIALSDDLNTVVGLGYYEHGETPGLGGEVDNPKWKAKWHGKKVYDDQGDVELSVIKGTVADDAPNAEFKVDGLSGATLTSRGVDNMIKFWLGEKGYGKFLENLKHGEA